MESQNYQKLLFFFSLTIISNSAIASYAPSFPYPTPEAAAPSPSPTPHPQPDVAAPTPSPELSVNMISLPPVSYHPPSESPQSAAPQPSQSPQSAAQPPSTSAAIQKICQSTDYPDICVSAITPYLNGKTDIESVVGMAIKAANEHTKLGIALATRLETSPSIPPPMKSIIGDCKGSYDDALDNFESALSALVEVDVGTMNSMLSAAITDFGDCDDFLDGRSSPLLDFNTVLRKMTSNCLAIVSLLPIVIV